MELMTPIGRFPKTAENARLPVFWTLVQGFMHFQMKEMQLVWPTGPSYHERRIATIGG